MPCNKMWISLSVSFFRDSARREHQLYMLPRPRFVHSSWPSCEVLEERKGGEQLVQHSTTLQLQFGNWTLGDLRTGAKYLEWISV